VSTTLKRSGMRSIRTAVIGLMCCIGWSPCLYAQEGEFLEDEVSASGEDEFSEDEALASGAGKAPEEVRFQGGDDKGREAFLDYQKASDRYHEEIARYKRDLSRTLLSEHQSRLSSVDSTYAPQISALRTEESRLRDEAIEQMESFLRRYGETNDKAADILFRLARLYYEQADEIYLSSSMDDNLEHPDFSKTLSYLDKLERNFPDYHLMDGVLYLRGYCLQQMGQGEAAKEAFLALLERYPESSRRAEVLTRVGEYYFSRSQDAILGLGGGIQWHEALKYYSEAVAIGDETSVYDRALYRKAWTEYYVENYDSMIRDFITLVGYADKDPNGSALRSEAIDFMAAALAEEKWDLTKDDVAIDPDFGMERFRNYLNTGAPFEAEVLRRFADTLTEQTRYDYAAQAYEAYLDLETCADDIPEVIRIYIASLNLSGEIDRAAREQADIDKRIGAGSAWYQCQRQRGNFEALRAADLASQQALKNSIMAYHDKVTRSEDTLRQINEDLEMATSDAKRAELTLAQAQARQALIDDNRRLAEITRDFIRRYPHDEEGYNYRYLLGQAYFFSEQYEASIEAFMAIRDIQNTRFQADAARYVADAYELLITREAERDQRYVYALPLQVIAEKVNTGQMPLSEAPTSILLSSALTGVSQEEIAAVLETRKTGTPFREMPQDVVQLIDAREVFSQIEAAAGVDERVAYGPQYRYDNAMIYYNYGNFEEAQKRFTLIIDSSPSSLHAASAADIIIAEYELRGDLDKVAELSDMYAVMQLGSADSDSIVNARFRDKKYNALFMKAFQLFDNKQYLEAAAEFIRIIEENPTFEHNNRALYNAAYAYEQMKHYDSAMQLYRRVLNEYGETEEAVNALYRIGVNAEKFFDFDTAVDSFLTLYDSRKPLYLSFKNRANALRNAAKIKLLVEERLAAASLLERYHNDFPGQADAPQFLYEAGRVYAEMGRRADAERVFRDFRRRYASDPSVRPFVIASYVVEADGLRGAGRLTQARDAYTSARSLFQQAPNAAGNLGRDNAAKAAFMLAEMDYEVWKSKEIKGKMATMTARLKEQMTEMARIVNQFALVMNYNSPVWGIAARYAIARMMHGLVDDLENISRPTDVRHGSDAHLAFLASMSDLATGTRDEAIKMYRNAIDASKLAGVSMTWTKQSLDGLKQLDRTAISQERMAESRDIYSTGSLVSPTRFQAQETAKQEAKARAEAAEATKGDE